MGDDHRTGDAATAPRLLTRQNLGALAGGRPLRERFLLKTMTRLEKGAVTMRFPDGSVWRYDSGVGGPDAECNLRNWRLPRRALFGGSIGVAESYMDGDWDSPDVTAFLSLFTVNGRLGDELTTPGLLVNAFHGLRHWMNANTLAGARRNIAAHYDLGNRFYRSWLDSTMTYSSAIFERKKVSLDEAQNAKYKSLARRVGIRPGDRVLEIGCGWGGFAEYAARNFDCHITGLTISKEQFDFARERMFKAGLNEKVDIRFQDYREERGKYDRIASIEMFEAVGEKYWPVYFECLRECLKKGGKAGLQIITIAERSYDLYRRRPDFIQRYIFPGGMLPTPAILDRLGKEAGLKLSAQHIFPLDYARTLAEWRRRFLGAWAEIRQQGFDERFRRMWEFYLHYCEAGFRSGNIDVRQVFFQKS